MRMQDRTVCDVLVLQFKIEHYDTTNDIFIHVTCRQTLDIDFILCIYRIQ